MKKLILAALLVASPALAQEPQPASPQAQAISNRLLIEINNSIVCEGNKIELMARIKELEAKVPKEEKK